MYGYPDRTLGAIDPVSVGATVVGGIAGLLGGGSKDPGRISRNKRMEEAALRGDAEAFKFLYAMSGQGGLYRGEPYCGGTGGCGGWASKPAKQDAAERYARVQAALSDASGRPQGVDDAMHEGLIPARPGVARAGVGDTMMIGLVVAGGLAWLASRPQRRVRR